MYCRSKVLSSSAKHYLILVILFLAAAGISGVTAYSVSAQTDLQSSLQNQNTAHQDAYYVYENMMSPFCPGLTLKDCPSGKAGELKQEILERLNKGEQKDQVLQSLIQKYGEEFRAMPGTSGFAALAWILPPAFMLIGFIIILRWFRGMKNGQNSES